MSAGLTATLRGPEGTGEARVVPLEGRTITEVDAASKSGRVAAIVEESARPPEAAWIDLETGAVEPLTDLNPHAEDWLRARRVRVAWENEKDRPSRPASEPGRPSPPSDDDPPAPSAG